MPPDPEVVVESLRRVFEPQREPVRAVAMSAYMRNLFPFLGIPTPERRRLTRPVLVSLGRPGEAELEWLADALWAFPEREYQYAAVDIVIHCIRGCRPAFLPVVRRLITTKSWWDTVDGLASQGVGSLVAAYPELQAQVDEWITDKDIWVARSAILHQLTYKSGTDPAQLFRCCLQRSGDKEFFIRKAIGWALREYSKTDATAVRAFVEDNRSRLSPLSQREALLWMDGRRKGASELRA